LALSPLDPLRHYYDALAASASLSVGNVRRAIELATRSLSSNRNHLPTLRALAIAQVESGAIDEALRTGKRILELDPGLTVSGYVARGPKGAESTRMRYAAALREAGIPA
jgi:tetratricopeptide (TPR) repeat protein